MTASMKNKTLLIPDNIFFEDMDVVEIGKLYKYPFRLSSQEKIQSAISSAEENTAYLHYFWSDQDRMFLGGVIDTHNGNILATLKPRAVSLEDIECLQAGTSYRTLIRMKSSQLKRLSRAIK